MPKYEVDFLVPGETEFSKHSIVSRKALSDEEIGKNLESYYSRQIDAESRGMYGGKEPKDYPYIPTNTQVPLEKGGVLIIPPKFATDPQAQIRQGFESYVREPVRAASQMIQAPGEALAPTLGPLAKAPGKALGGLAEMMTDTPQDLLGTLGGALGPLGYAGGRAIGNLAGGSTTSAPELGIEAGKDLALGTAAQLGTNWLTKKFLDMKDAHVAKQLEKYSDEFMSKLSLPGASKEEMLRNPEVFFKHLGEFQNKTLQTLINNDMDKAVKSLIPLVNPQAHAALDTGLKSVKSQILKLGSLDKIADPRGYFNHLQGIEDTLAKVYKIGLINSQEAAARVMFDPSRAPGLATGAKHAVSTLAELRTTISKALESNAELETRKYIVQKIAEGANPQKAMMEAMAALKARNGDINALSDALFTRTVELTKNPQLARAISSGQVGQIADDVVTDMIKGTGKQGLTVSLLKAGASGIQAGVKAASPLYQRPVLRTVGVLNPTAIELIKESLGLKSKPSGEN